MPEIPIDSIVVGQRFRKEIGDLSDLQDSIARIGLLHPIVVDENLNLVAGYRRLKAFQNLKREKIPATKINLTEIIEGEFDENFVRKGFTVSEMVAIKRALEKRLAGRAGRPPKDGGKDRESRQFSGRSEKIIQKMVGKAHQYVSRAEAIVDAAHKEPEKYGKLLQHVDAGTTSVHYAFSSLTHKVPTPDLPEGEFNVIYGDPPWTHVIPLRGAPKWHYSTMSGEEIAQLKIPSSKQAVLFMWATNANLLEALDVMKAWGFVYKTNLVWVKDKWGTGNYFRGQHELLLLGIKGDMPPPRDADRPSSVLQSKRREHSTKPDEVYPLIERMYPKCKYLELFARRKREGWTSWGHGVRDSGTN